MQQLWKIVFQSIKVLNTDLPHNPAILLNIYSLPNENICPHKDLNTDGHRSPICNSQISGNNLNDHQMIMAKQNVVRT